VPDDVWGHVDLLIYDAITGDSDDWERLKDAARTYRSRQPEIEDDQEQQEDSKQRRTVEEISVELDDHTRLRGEVVAELAAARPGVQSFRKRHLQGRLLSNREADSFLHTDRDTRQRNAAQRALRRLGEDLERAYGWDARRARRFVLTGRSPAPVRLSVAAGGGKARIRIDAEPWVATEEVARVYRVAQRQLLGGDTRKIPVHRLEAFRFVRRHTQQDGSRPSWAKLKELWNEQHPEHSYKERNGLLQAFTQVSERLMRPKYRRPQWKEHATYTTATPPRANGDEQAR